MRRFTTFALESPEFGTLHAGRLYGEPIYKLSDICSAFGIEDANTVADLFLEDEEHHIVFAGSGDLYPFSFVTSTGLRLMAMYSRSRNAKDFCAWAFQTVYEEYTPSPASELCAGCTGDGPVFSNDPEYDDARWAELDDAHMDSVGFLCDLRQASGACRCGGED